MIAAVDTNARLPVLVTAGTWGGLSEDVQIDHVPFRKRPVDAHTAATSPGSFSLTGTIRAAYARAAFSSYEVVVSVPPRGTATEPLDLADGATTSNAYYVSKAFQITRSNPKQRASDADEGQQRVSNALFLAYALEAKGEPRSAAREIMAFIEECLNVNSLVETNRLLADANIEAMTSRSLIGLIRSTFVARSKLPAWERAYARAWRRAEAIGRDPESIFVGLPKPADAR